MPYTTAVAGTTITASWANASVRDQVVTPFASSAARTSAITSVIEGMVTYQADTDQLEIYDGVTWRIGASLGASTTYTPTWTGSVSNPVLGNAVVNSSYQQVGRRTHYEGSIVMGSTTTYGSGSYQMSAPVGLASTARANGLLYLADTSAPANDRMGLFAGSGAALFALLTSAGNVGPTNPFTFATGDSIRWAIITEGF